MQIKVFQTGCGDAISISYEGKSGQKRRILIDSGYMYSFYDELLPWLSEFPEGEKIDLWILTHLDADHINGAFAYFSSKGESLPKGIIERVWFNFFGEFPIADESENISYDKAFNLRDSLATTGCKDINNNITISMDPFELDGAKITILSPDQASYEQLRNDWEKEEESFLQPDEPEDIAGAVYLKDKEKVLTLSKIDDRTESMTDTTNRSSIAFLFEKDTDSILMLGDAFPSVVAHSIGSLLKERGLDKLKVKYVKLSHHGSIKNYSKVLYDLIDCKEYIICSDGYNKSKIPNKETLSKILVREDKSEPVIFHCNYRSDRYTDMFEADAEELPDYNFSFNFPEDGETQLLIPKKNLANESED